MRRTCVFLLLVFLLISLGGFCLSAEGPNLLRNGGAEFSSGKMLPDYWTRHPDALDAICSTDRVEYYSGSASFKIETLQENHSGTVQYTYYTPEEERPKVPVGTKIKVGLTYKTSGFAPGQSGKVVFTIRRHHGWAILPLETYELDSDNTSWTSFEAEYTVPAGLPSPVPISVSVGIENAGGMLWFDDVFLKIIDATEDNVPPETPKGLAANRVAKSVVQLKWGTPSAASDGDLPIMYKIYRSNIPGFPPNNNNFVGEAKYGEPYFDYGLQNGVRYYYKIAAIDKMGNLAFSDEVVANHDVSYGKNLVSNGSFEQWQDGKPVGWWVKEGEYISACDVYKVDGSYSVKLSSDNDELYVNVSHRVDLTPNTDYTLIGWIKGDNIKKVGKGAMLHSSLPIGVQSYDGTFDWQLVYHEFNSEGNTSITLTPYLHYSTGTVYFDSIGLYSSHIDGFPPNSPIEFEVAPINGEEKVLLSWEAPDKAADGDLPVAYRIYKGTGPEQMSFTEEISASSVSWLDKNASGDIRNYYYVTSVDKAGNESEPSELIYAEKRSVVSGKVKALDEENNFQPVSGAEISLEGTEIDTTSEADGSFSLKHLVGGEYTLLAQAKNYQRKRTTFSIGLGEEKILEDIILEWDTIPPDEPRELTVENDIHVGIVVLKWREPEEAEDGEIAESYNIFHSDSEIVERIPRNLLASTTNTYYKDIGKEEDFGKCFYYIIEAIDGAGNPSEESSNTACAVIIPPPIPSPVVPKNRSLFAGEEPSFEWEIEQDPDLEGFLIQISTDKSFSKGKVSEKASYGLDTNFSWSEHLEQSLWYWRMKALYTEVESSWSETNEFVTIVLDDKLMVPYINTTPSILQGEHVKIDYFLTDEANVQLKIYNLGGGLVVELVSSRKEGGSHEVIWPGNDARGGEVPNGLYIIQLLVTKDDGKREKVSKKIVVYR